MIGWLLTLSLSWLGYDPAASAQYARLADRFATEFQVAYATAPEIPPTDLGALYADAAGTVQRTCMAALDTYAAAMQPAAPQAAPVDLGAVYADASDAIRRGYSTARNACLMAMRPLPRPAPRPKAEPGDSSVGSIVAAASRQFDLPEPWIQALIRVESAGEAGAVSPKGAMGLTQVMPATYAYLSDRYDLGKDPYQPHDNIFAGSAYLREMYDRYGPAGFLAAYNAGPGRYDDYQSHRSDLPEETKRYVAAVQLAVGEALFADPNSRFYQPLAISSRGELLLGKTNQPLPAAERLALHSLVAKAVERAGGRK